MNSQKYSSKKGRPRLSRNFFNLSLFFSPSNPSWFTSIDSELGTLLLDKAKQTNKITLEYKEQMMAHKLWKTYYGDVNKSICSQTLTQIESRLDVLVYRTGIPQSIFEARSLIRHNKVLVNDFPISHIWSHVSVGASIRILSYNKKLTIANPAPHLIVKHLANKETLVIFKSPLDISKIRFPKNFDLDKLNLSHSI